MYITLDSSLWVFKTLIQSFPKKISEKNNFLVLESVTQICSITDKTSRVKLHKLSNVFFENNECVLAGLYKSLVEMSLTDTLSCGRLSSAAHTGSHFEAF